jgi:hypothetical protein
MINLSEDNLLERACRRTGLSRLLKNSNRATVAALYERRFFLESTKYRRSQTAASTVDSAIQKHFSATC